MKKKVLFVISSLRGGGAERVAVVLANELAKRNDLDISILLLYEDKRAYNLDEKVKVVKLPPIVSGKSRIARILKTIKTLRESILAFAPDVVVPFIKKTSILVYLAIRGAILIIASEHTIFRRHGIYVDALRRYVFKRVNHITCINQHDYKKLSRINRNTSIIYNPSPFRKEEKILCERGSFAICIGSLNRYQEKGIDELITSWTRIIEQDPNLKLHILGSGDKRMEDELKTLISQLGLTDFVFLEGFQSDLIPWYSKAEMLISASKIESFSMTLIEAQTLGCPVVSFDCPYGPREIITHEINGLLVPNQEYGKLTDAILHLHNDKQLRMTLSENGLINADRFSKERIAQKWYDLFNEIV